MKMLSLFSGIGGLDLAAHWAGIETVAFCEIDPFCRKILAKHWPDVPIFDDVKTLTKEALERAGIGTIDIICGGYPCQPFSCAGKRLGQTDDRHLWPEMYRIIQDIRPRWVVCENVAGHVTMGLDNVLTDLDNADYAAQALIIPACGVGAYHRRNRLFVMANLNGKRMERCTPKQVLGIANISGGQNSKSFSDTERRYDTFESRLCRSLHGLPSGVDRTRSLGNAVVPQQAYPVFAAIMEVEQWQSKT